LALMAIAVLCVSAGSVSGDMIQASVGLAASLVCVTVLAVLERRSAAHVLPPSVFMGGSALALLYVMIAMLNAIVTASEIFVPLFVQELHGQSPLTGGYYAAAMAGGWTVGSLVTSGVAERTARRAMVVAPLIAMVAMAILAMTLPVASGGTVGAMVPIGLCLIFVGFGVGLAWPHLLSNVLKFAPDYEQSLASGAITTVQLFATAMAAAIAGMVANATGLLDPGPVATGRAAFALLALCTAIALGAVVIGAALLKKMQSISRHEEAASLL
jgi:predicted MFS family arabinose efflux permease